MTPNEDEHLPPDDPAASLRLIHQEQANLVRRLTPDPRLMYWPWGFAWLIGFGAIFLRYSPGGRPLVAMPDWLPLVILMTVLIAAGVVSGVAGGRAARQVAGPSSRQGLMYGLTWSLAFAGMSVVFAQFTSELPSDRVELLWGGGMVALTGALHMAGGAVWNDRQVFILGAWTTVVNVVGIGFGAGWHSLIVAVAGGGGMLVLGLIGWLRLR
jgi:hypothetical protein